MKACDVINHCLLLCLVLPSVTSQEAKDDLVDFKKAGLSTAQETARKTRKND